MTTPYAERTMEFVEDLLSRATALVAGALLNLTRVEKLINEFGRDEVSTRRETSTSAYKRVVALGHPAVNGRVTTKTYSASTYPRAVTIMTRFLNYVTRSTLL